MNDEKPYVVVKDGKRASENLTEADAKSRAEKVLKESQGEHQTESVSVKRVING